MTDHNWLISQYVDFTESSEYMETVTAEGNLPRSMSMAALGAVGSIVVLRRVGYRLHFNSALGGVILLAAAWCAASLTWSIEPALAARRLIAIGCVAVAALAAAKLLQPRELAAAALTCAVAYLGLGVLTEVALGSFQPWNGNYRFSGTLHPNNQGLNCALIVMSSISLLRCLPRQRFLLWSLVGTGLAGLWFTKSRTPLAALVVAQVLFWFLAAPWQKKLGWGLAAICLVSGATLVSGSDLLDRFAKVALLGRDDEEQLGALTGRVPLWEELSESVARRPLAGYGFSSFWIPRNIEEISDSQYWAISVGHSAYLDLTLGVGLVGAGLCVLVMFWSLARALRRHLAMPSAGFNFLGVLLTFALLHGLLESAFANPGFVPLVVQSGIAMLAFVSFQDYLPARMESGLSIA